METTPNSDNSGAAPAEQLRVGVVGAGPWARLVHAPMFAYHPGTRLVGVWARRPEAAADVASSHDARAFASFDEMIDEADPVALAVPHDVQAEMGVTAARAGKPLLLEKPVALDLDAAQRLVDAVDEAGVLTQVLLTWRYAPAVRAFFDEVASIESPLVGGRGQFLGGGSLAGPFATPWRLEHGPLPDLGPHVVDALDAALGHVTGVRAHGDPQRWVGLLLEHETGVVSEVSMTASSPLLPVRAGIEVYTEAGVVEVDTATAVGPDAITNVVDEFVATAQGTPHPLDVHHGLHLQTVLEAARRDLTS